MAIHLDEEENAIRQIDVNFGHPNFKVSINDIVFKRAEDLARQVFSHNHILSIQPDQRLQGY